MRERGAVGGGGEVVEGEGRHGHLGSIARTISATLSVIARASLNFLLGWQQSRAKHASRRHHAWQPHRSSPSARRISPSLSALAPPISPARRNWMNCKGKSVVKLGSEYLLLQPCFSHFRFLALHRIKINPGSKARANIPSSCPPPPPPHSSSRTRRCVPGRLRTYSSNVTTNADEAWWR